jgi:hypothetical protein
MVLDLTGSKSKIVFESLPSDDLKQRQPDIRKAMKELDWRPTIKLREGIAAPRNKAAKRGPQPRRLSLVSFSRLSNRLKAGRGVKKCRVPAALNNGECG